MKMRTKIPIKKAVHQADETARRELCSKPYPKVESLSSLKLIVGGLLLFGNKKQKVFWPFFEAMLRQYEDLRHISQDGTEQSGATI